MKSPQRVSKETNEQSIDSGPHCSRNFCRQQVKVSLKCGAFLHSSRCTHCCLGGKGHREESRSICPLGSEVRSKLMLSSNLYAITRSKLSSILPKY